MAGETHQIDIGNDHLVSPWPTLFDVVAATRSEEWVVVGGLMVQLHAYRAGIVPSRLTRDVDLVVDVATPGVSFASVTIGLTSAGFSPLVPSNRNSPIYRFERDAEQVDVMVPDHLPRHISPRFMLRPAFPVEAGQQALTRRDHFVIDSARGTIAVAAPDILGALVGKAAAHIVDQRNPGRHLEDAAVLLATIDSVGVLNLRGLTASDRRRLRRLNTHLTGTAPAWMQLDPANRRTAQQNLARLVVVAGL